MALGDNIKEIVGLLEMKASLRNLSLECEIERGLPEDFYTDPKRLKQILINLVSNAIKFTFKGSITISARFLNKKSQNLIQISVKDTGIGIKQKDMLKLFQMFSMLGSSQHVNKSGTGMGLFISKNLSGYLTRDGG